MNLTAKQLIDTLRNAAQNAGFTVHIYGTIKGWPLLAMTRQAVVEDGRRVYLSSGIHGDEPAGPLALLELLEADALPKQHHYWICPILNPFGLDAGQRENSDGLDLNRDYREFVSEEIRQHVEWTRQQIDTLDLALHLHEDWEAKGFYLYELNFSERKGYADKLLAAASAHLPIETASEIDGSPASNGIIRPESLPEIEEGHPEAIYFQQTFGGLNYTLETPSALKLEKRVAAHKAAILAVLQSI